jgi:phospholipase C
VTGNSAFINKDLTLGPLGHGIIDLGQLIEGHISAKVIQETLQEDDDALPVPGHPHPAPTHPGPPPGPRKVSPVDFTIELLRDGARAAIAKRTGVTSLNVSPSHWQVRLTSTLKKGTAIFRVHTEVPAPEPFAELDTSITVDGSQGGTVKKWSVITALPPHTAGTLTAQTVQLTLGSQITLDFMLGTQAVASARNHLLTFTPGSAALPLTLRVTCDAPSAEQSKPVTVRVTYPSDRRILTKQAPIAFFSRVFDEFWNIRIPQPLGISILDNTLHVDFDPALIRQMGLSNITAPMPVFDAPFVGNDIRITGLVSKRITWSAGTGPNPRLKVLPDSRTKYDQAAFFAIDIEFDNATHPKLDVHDAPDFSLFDVSLRVELHLSDLIGSLDFFPVATLNMGVDTASADLAGKIVAKARENFKDALTKPEVRFALTKFANAMRPWFLGGPFEVVAAGSRFGEIWIDYVEPPHVSAPERPRVPVSAGNLSKIGHIVVLTMENRSFDHMLGYLSLPDAPTGSPKVNGLHGGEVNHFRGQDFPSHLLSKTFIGFSPCHEFDCTRNQISGNMGGFVANFAEHHEAEGADISLVMGHYNGTLLPVYDQLAKQFATCDRWHAAHPGPTWPNRFITISGHLNTDQFGQVEADNPDLATFAPSRAESIFDVLTANNVSWRYYENGYSFARLFARYTFDVENVRGFSSFLSDAAAGKLPQVSFVDPDFIEFPPGFDDHAPADPIDGQVFVGTVANALFASPNWSNCLLIVTYDEHGGFYDHVQPPATPVKFEGEMDLYGVRVPTFLVSPYVEPGFVPKQNGESVQFDHASVLATIQHRFLGPLAPDLAPRVAHAADVGAALTRTAPRPAPAPIPLPPKSTEPRIARPIQNEPFPSLKSQEFTDLLFLAQMFTGMGPK